MLWSLRFCNRKGLFRKMARMSIDDKVSRDPRITALADQLGLFVIVVLNKVYNHD